MKLKVWGLIPITKNQLIIVQTLVFSFFFILTIFFFSYDFPDYIDDPLVLFHSKYLKYVCLIAAFLTVVETQLYLNQLIRGQLLVNKLQKEKIELKNSQLKVKQQEILNQQDEIKTQRDNAIEQHRLIKLQKEKITDSIRYASRIQTALLPPVNKIPTWLDHFILFKPKDIVSGDYYWVSKNKDKTIIVAADCTGHGVPGAFMSVMGIAFLNEIVSRAEGELLSCEILDKLRDKVTKAFHRDKENNKRSDGMDIAMYIIDEKKKELQYSGANNPLFLVRKSDEDKSSDLSFDSKIKVSDNGVHKLIHFKGDSMPVGHHPNKTPFKCHLIKLQKNDTFYVFSDGYVDQFGGETGKRFLTSRFKQLLLKIQDKSMEDQMQILDKTMDNWINYKTGQERKIRQMDDILVLGVRIK